MQISGFENVFLVLLFNAAVSKVWISLKLFSKYGSRALGLPDTIESSCLEFSIQQCCAIKIVIHILRINILYLNKNFYLK